MTNLFITFLIILSVNWTWGDLVKRVRFNPSRGRRSNYTRYFSSTNPGQINPLRLAGPWRGEGSIPFRLGAFGNLSAGSIGAAPVKSTPAAGQLKATAQAATINKAASNKANQASSGGRSGPTANMSHQGGPVMVNGCNLYLIYYGDWSTDPSTIAILEHLSEFIGGSRFYDLVSNYYSTRGEKLFNQVVFVKSIRPTDQGRTHSYKGTSIQESAIVEIVKDALSAPLNPLPVDPNGLYMVVTAANIKETSGMCSDYCGWHDSTTKDGQIFQYGFLGCPKPCPSNCAEQSKASPNGNWVGDAMASILFHEIIEAATDPHGTAWYDKNSREEIADTCAWLYGDTRTATTSDGKSYKYNTVINSKQYLLQQIWVNDKGCVGGGQ